MVYQEKDMLTVHLSTKNVRTGQDVLLNRNETPAEHQSLRGGGKH